MEEKIRDKNVKYDAYIITNIVDCLVRSGKFKEGTQVIWEYEQFSNYDYVSDMWIVVLNACKQHKVLAQEVYNELSDRFDNDPIVMNSVFDVMRKHN